MIDRIKYNWTLTRALYLVMGLMMIVQSAISKELTGILFGGYFASMGLFAFGCASGNCHSNFQQAPKKNNTKTEDVSFEEIKL